MRPPDITAQVERVGRVFLTRRPFVVGPLAAWVVLVLHAGETALPQRLVVTLGLTLGFTLFTVEALVARRRPISSTWLFASLAVTLLAVSVLATVLGGLSGPFLPMLFAPAGVGFAAFGSSRRALTLLVAMGLALAVMSLVPSGTPFPALASQLHRLIALGASVAAALLLVLGVGALSSAYARAAEQVVRTSEELVAQAHARVRGIEELTGHFGHELKNPLAAVKAVLELLAEGETDERANKRLTVARTEVQRMEATLERGLDFTRPATSARRQQGPLHELVKDVVAVLEPHAAQKQVALSVDAPPLEVSHDAGRVREALLNLLLNAIEAAPRDSRVEVVLRHDASDVDLTVTDHGPVLSPNVLARLGTPFFTTREGGTGLGVAMARQTAAQHGGTLTYSSDAAGTCATLRFPRSASAGLEELT